MLAQVTIHATKHIMVHIHLVKKNLQLFETFCEILTLTHLLHYIRILNYG